MDDVLTCNGYLVQYSICFGTIGAYFYYSKTDFERKEKYDNFIEYVNASDKNHTTVVIFIRSDEMHVNKCKLEKLCAETLSFFIDMHK